MIERLKLVRDYRDKYGVFPTYSEMCVLFRVASKNSTFKFIQKAILEGYLKKVGRRLAPTDKFNQL